ncbi:hypothetical protein GCK72_021908 [Caenorhabditis remanei]|uniref:Ubiquitin-like domain-containing protein n=1 Tax=Caenorhabditis remanei TaxID=31234 RepID=A0A6A5GM13_CAERE|nr:hypothetical protein GCK72_021908 [Caenorhabditis remanei]KAF1755339.1 hypothetical protein GCK72_021908 [Caenorhabditis remanei]
MLITVHTLSIGSFEIDVEPTDTVRQVKGKIQAVYHRFPIEEQFLIFRRRGMADMQMVSDYGITEGDAVHMRLEFARRSNANRVLRYASAA